MNLRELLSFRRIGRGAHKERDSEDVSALMAEIDDVKKLIDTAGCNFNNVTDADSIDYYTYILKAYQVRHDMLIKQLKAELS